MLFTPSGERSALRSSPFLRSAGGEAQNFAPDSDFGANGTHGWQMTMDRRTKSLTNKTQRSKNRRNLQVIYQPRFSELDDTLAFNRLFPPDQTKWRLGPNLLNGSKQVTSLFTPFTESPHLFVKLEKLALQPPNCIAFLSMGLAICVTDAFEWYLMDWLSGVRTSLVPFQIGAWKVIRKVFFVYPEWGNCFQLARGKTAVSMIAAMQNI